MLKNTPHTCAPDIISFFFLLDNKIIHVTWIKLKANMLIKIQTHESTIT